MKRILFGATFLLLQNLANAQAASKPTVLYGAIQKENLLAAPFGE